MRAFSIILILLTGCASLPTGQKLGQAAHNAFFNMRTLAPLAVATIFYSVENFDERVSDWAIKHHPIFGSGENARDASYTLKDILEFETFVTAIATSNGNNPQDRMYFKLKSIGVAIAAKKAVNSTTGALKHATGRARPDDGDDQSFPSGNASSAFSFATLSNRNINYIDSIWLSDNLKENIQFGNLFLASSAAWARVEGSAHYPSDVLAGAALGHFLSAFIYDAFLGLPENEEVSFLVVPFEGGAMAQLSFHF